MNPLIPDDLKIPKLTYTPTFIVNKELPPPNIFNTPIDNREAILNKLKEENDKLMKRRTDIRFIERH